ncbi:hypothetical protein HZB00_04115, partial [Candidatus Woesearchaeota archaeon]|nr:hypothetical protein [Candidatus Woesearchaeota archaeon]
MLHHFIASTHLSLLEKERTRFSQAEPFRFLVLDHFLLRSVALDLRKQLLQQKFQRMESDLYSFAQTNDLSILEDKTLLSFFSFLNSKEFKNYLFQLTGIQAFGTVDCSGFIYSDTDHLLPHDDRLETRKIAYVLNLSDGFTQSEGG